MGFLEEVAFNPSFKGSELSSLHGLLPDNQAILFIHERYRLRRAEARSTER